MVQSHKPCIIKDKFLICSLINLQFLKKSMESLQQFLIENLYNTNVCKVEEQFLFDISC